jgi:hypothetical protein
VRSQFYQPKAGFRRDPTANLWNIVARSSTAVARPPIRTWARQLLRLLGRVANKIVPAYAKVVRSHYVHHQAFRLFFFPRTFNELIQYKKIFNRDPLLTLTSDKVRVRQYVREKIGEHHLVPLRTVAKSPQQIDFRSLPDAFVIKANHGSGFNRFITDKRTVDRAELNEAVTNWLKTDFSAEDEEWAYRNIQRRVLVEDMLSHGGEIPDDYKFFVFKGRVRLIQLDQCRHKSHSQNLYDENWRQLNVEFVSPRSSKPRQQPAELGEMIRIAEVLGHDFEFARIDLYLIDGKIFFGEVTHYPNRGLMPFKPREFDRVLGDLWRRGGHIPSRYYLAEVEAAQNPDWGNGSLHTPSVDVLASMRNEAPLDELDARSLQGVLDHIDIGRQSTSTPRHQRHGRHGRSGKLRSHHR